MTRAAVQAPRALRITDQVRTTRGYAYDLAIEERRLTVRIEEIPAAGGFRVEARARDRASSDEQSAKADARSRGAALRAVGEAWPALDGPKIDFDWQAVEVLLDGVRAL